MKITFILPHISLSGGVRVVATLADRLQRRGHEVLVVSPSRAPVSLRHRLRHIKNGAGWRHPNAFDFGYFKATNVPVKVLERYRPVVAADLPDADVIVATWWETAEWVAGMPASKGTKAYFIQGDDTCVPNQPTDKVIATLSLPMHKITISRWLVDLIAQRSGDYDVSLMPNSVDQDQFHAPPRSKQKHPTVGMLYHTSPSKGVKDALEAFERVKQKIPNVKLVSFGALKPMDFLPLPAGTDFTYLPAQDNIRDIYARCDVWLCASHREGFHLPPLEAMACRCPVVSTRVGGPLDVIKDGLNGYLVDVGDAEALAERMLELLKCDETRWRAFSDAAYQTAIQYSWDDAARLFEGALESAVSYVTMQEPDRRVLSQPQSAIRPIIRWREPASFGRFGDRNIR